LFVHGIDSGPGVWQSASATSIAGQAAALPGTTAWTFSYASESLLWVTTRAIGPDLAEAISCLAAVSGHRVIVVGHSMGGLAAQFAIGMPRSPAAGHLAELITIGTPFEGSQILTDGERVISGGGLLAGDNLVVVAVEAILSACAGVADHLDVNLCGLASVLRSPVGTALEAHSAAIADLPAWPAGLPVFDTAGNISMSVQVGRIYSRGFDIGDGAVTLSSAIAHNTAGTPDIQHCATSLSRILNLAANPCFHTSLPGNPAIVAAVLDAIRAAEAAQNSSVVPVLACPTSYGVQGTPKARYPATETVALSSDLGSQLAYYSDAARSVQPILGPRGWACSAEIGADGSLGIAVYPRSAAANSPAEVDAHNDSACVGCMYSDACQLIPNVAAELHFPNVPCPAATPPQQALTWIAGSPNMSNSGTDVVGFVDPPHVKGFAAPSGGPYTARGLMLYSWGQPPPPGISNVSVINCTLPSSDSQLCTAILTAFRQQNWTGR
jgi:pimeloyl-ACP methyl ester carboxylesterase